MCRRFDLTTGKELEPLGGHQERVTGMAIAAEGKTIASCAMDGTVRLFDSDGRERRRFDIPKKYGVGVGISPDGKRLACGSYESEIHVWDTATGRELWRVKSDASRISAQAFSSDGKTLVTGGDKLTWWDAATGKVLREIDGPHGTFHLVAFSSVGNRIVTAGKEGAPRFWDAETGKEILRFEGHQHAVLQGVFRRTARRWPRSMANTSSTSGT